MRRFRGVHKAGVGYLFLSILLLIGGLATLVLQVQTSQDVRSRAETISSPSAASVSTASIPDSQGTQHVLVLMMNFQNTTQPSLTKDQAKDMIFNKLNALFKDSSYNKMSLTGDVFGWYKVNVDQTCDPNKFGTALVLAANNDVNFTQYNRLILLAPLGSGCPAGVGSNQKESVFTPDGQASFYPISINLSKITDLTQITQEAGHQLGHSLGLDHANLLTCGNSTLASSGCSTVDHGDIYDIMGQGMGEANAEEREYEGWLPSSQIKTISGVGSYTIEPLETVTSGIKALKIVRKDNSALYIEYRQALGSDTNLTSVQGTDITQGVLLHLISSGSHGTSLLDASPPVNDKPTTVSLKPGMSFTEPSTGLHLSVSQVNTSGATVTVTTGSTTGSPTATPAPTKSITPTPTPQPTAMPNEVRIAVQLVLDGIGAGGDHTNPKSSSLSNKNPLHQQLPLAITISDASGQTKQANCTVVYNKTDGVFDGNISLGTSYPAGTYTLRFLIPKYLTRKVSVQLQPGQTTQVPQTNLVAGDINGDNNLSILDYNILDDCGYASPRPLSMQDKSSDYNSAACKTHPTGANADLDDNGIIDARDFNLFIRELPVGKGD